MSTSTLDKDRDVRTFENAVELTPEEELATRAHFERKGMQIERVNEEGQEESPASSETVEDKPDVAATTTTDGAAAPVVEDPAIDDETRAEWQTAKNDGEKLGRHARKNKELRELRAKEAAWESEKQRYERELAAAKTAAPVAASSITTPAVVAPVAEPEKKKEAVAPKTFEQARPVKPKFEDFADVDGDQYAAHSAAVADHAEKLAEWFDSRRTFEQEQRELQAKEEREERQRNDQVTTQKNATQRAMDEKFAAVRKDLPDFDQVTGAKTFTGVLLYVLRDQLKDGLHLAYELSKPENAETLRTLTEMTPETKDLELAKEQATEAILELGAFRKELKAKKTATPKPAATTPVQTPSVPKPTREEAAPVPNRGHAAATLDPKDVPEMDSDTRRKLRYGRDY